MLRAELIIVDSGCKLQTWSNEAFIAPGIRSEFGEAIRISAISYQLPENRLYISRWYKC